MAKTFPSKSPVSVWIGRSFMAISVAFICVRLWDYRNSVGEQLANPKLLISTLLSSGAYAVSGFFLALGWWLILVCRTGVGKSLKWKSAWRIYGKTQIAKYIPGNIFHFAGRHVLAAKAGASHALLVLAATGEIIMMLVATGLISLLAIGILLQKISHHLLLIEIAIGCAFFGLIILGIVSQRFGLRNMIREIEWQKLIGAELSYICFFSVSVILFLFLLFLENGPLTDWRLIAGGYALAWAIGFVVPGAPAGLGIREAMLVTFLSGVLEEKSVLVTAILFRIVTTLGDVMFFLMAGANR